MNASTLELTLIVLGILLVGVVVFLAFSLRRPPIAVLSAEPAADKSVEKPKARVTHLGVITINEVRFEFDYEEADQEEVKRLVDLIRKSIVLAGESRYEDIVNSRISELRGLLKKLGERSTLDAYQQQEMQELVRSRALGNGG